MGKLDQKVAIITGGAKGIGKQIALTFAAEGCDIVIGDMTEMETTVHEIGGLGRKVIAVKTDVSKRDEVSNLINSAIASFGKIDIVVNNAGITRHANVVEMSEEDWDSVLDVNLKGVFLCTQAAAKYMIERKYGKIINIASIAGQNVVHPRTANYSASKAGVIQFTKVCAKEFGSYGINVNAIAPGQIMTDIVYSRRTPEEAKLSQDDNRKLSAIGRLGTTHDIANLALFLVSDESSYITGQVIASDGGRL